MAHSCEFCGKQTATGNNRSHSNRATRRTWKVNLQKVTFNGKSSFACARCMKTMMKQV